MLSRVQAMGLKQEATRMKLLIAILFAIMVLFLFTGLWQLFRGNAKSTQSARSLTVRITLAIIVFLLAAVVIILQQP